MNYLQTGHCLKCGAPIFTSKPMVIREAGLVVFTGDPDPDVYFSCFCFNDTQRIRIPEKKLATLDKALVIP